MDVPVWVERQNVDLKICMYDRLYQDTILVNNRATTALRLRFEVTMGEGVEKDQYASKSRSYGRSEINLDF